MGLIKLHFVGFVDESSKEHSYIDTVLYDPIYIRADKIATLYPHDDEGYPIPQINKNSINDGENLIEMIVDDFNDINDFKQGSEITFEEDYTNCLFKTLRYNIYNPYRKTKQFIVYESPKEIIRLINGEDVPLEAISNQERIVIDELDLTVRTTGCLRSAGIDTISDLIKLTEVELIMISGLGKKSITDIKDKLAERGFCLGMKTV